jgi:hypothetical protein
LRRRCAPATGEGFRGSSGVQQRQQQAVFVENGVSVVLDSNMTLTDPDGDPFNGTTLSIFINDNAVLGGSGTLSFAGGNVLIGAVVIGTYLDFANERDIFFQRQRHERARQGACPRSRST